jgi:hypothetical protein
MTMHNVFQIKIRQLKKRGFLCMKKKLAAIFLSIAILTGLMASNAFAVQCSGWELVTSYGAYCDYNSGACTVFDWRHSHFHQESQKCYCDSGVGWQYRVVLVKDGCCS